MSRRRTLEDGIRVAIGDPNSIVGKRQPDPGGYVESFASWQIRAVMKLLAKHGLVEPEK